MIAALQAVRALVPEGSDIMLLEPEELAGAVLAGLKSLGANYFVRHNFMLALSHYPHVMGVHVVGEVQRAFAEAWAWLENEGLLIPMAEQPEYYFISRRGHRLADPDAFRGFREASRLPRALLHPAIEREAWQSFIRGRFDTAVFEAFREVEVTVREACGFDARVIGTDLMRAAFHSDIGPLTDKTLPKGERDALGHLFAGAIGSYKNPVSHRRVGIVDGREAGELLLLASHLLRIVDDRSITLTESAV